MKIKNAARTVIIDSNNLTAIIDVRNGEYHKIPGGGIEANESPEEAALREALEEAGCQVEIISYLGEHQFTDSHPEFGVTLHHSVCYLARKIGQGTGPSFDDWEKSNNFKLSWVTFEEAEQLFSKINTTDKFGIEINRRDLSFLKKARGVLGI